MINIEITEIEIIPIKPRDGLVAFASCVINESLYVGSIGIHCSPSNAEGFRLVFPSKTLLNGKEIPCVHPINKEAGELLTRAIVNKFRKIVEKRLDENVATIERESR